MKMSRVVIRHTVNGNQSQELEPDQHLAHSRPIESLRSLTASVYSAVTLPASRKCPKQSYHWSSFRSFKTHKHTLLLYTLRIPVQFSPCITIRAALRNLRKVFHTWIKSVHRIMRIFLSEGVTISGFTNLLKTMRKHQTPWR